MFDEQLIHPATEPTNEIDVRKSGKDVSRKDGYHNTLLTGEDSPGKIRMRDTVVDLVLDTCSWSKKHPLNFVSLPGPRWVVEHELFRRTDTKARFTAFEHNESLMLKGAFNVPRLEKVGGHGFRKLNDLDVPYFKTNSARWMQVDFLDWCLTEDSMVLPHLWRQDPLHDPWEFWLQRYWSADAFWLDFTSPLYQKMIDALTRMPKLVGNDKGNDKPIVVTVQKGRECCKATKLMRDLAMTRGELIAFLLDRREGHKLEVIEEYEYKSVGGVTMTNLVAVWRNTQNKCKN